MPQFSARSREQLLTCDGRLQAVFNFVIDHYDCQILEGSRTPEAQAINVLKGVSKTMNSKHVHSPSRAVDVAPFPIDWNNRERFVHFAGFVKGVASTMGVSLRWGGDWDSDFDLKDQTFFDLPHFEILD